MVLLISALLGGLCCLGAPAQAPLGFCEPPAEQEPFSFLQHRRKTSATTLLDLCDSTAFDCATFGGPLKTQINFTAGGSCFTTLQVLDLTPGNEGYRPLCTSPLGECHTSCTLDPFDNMIYCQDFDFGDLVRLTCSANLTTPGTVDACFLGFYADGRSEVATFNPVETPFSRLWTWTTSNELRFFSQGDGNISSFDGYVSPPPAFSLSSTNRVSSPRESFSMVISRFVVNTTAGDEIGAPNGFEWAIGCTNTRTVVIQSITENNTGFRYVLTLVGGQPLGRASTAWNFNGSIYCAYEDAVYEILVDSAVVDNQTSTGEVATGIVANVPDVPVSNVVFGSGLNCAGSTPFPAVQATTTTTTTSITSSTNTDTNTPTTTSTSEEVTTLSTTNAPSTTKKKPYGHYGHYGQYGHYRQYGQYGQSGWRRWYRRSLRRHRRHRRHRRQRRTA